MSLSSEVKTELSRYKTTKECCKLAELSAIIRLDGHFFVDTIGNISVTVSSDNPSVAKKTITLLVELFDFHADLRIENTHVRGKSHQYIIELKGDRIHQILNELGLINDSVERNYLPPKRLLVKSCCLTAYLRGTFLAAGSISDTESGSHLEISFSDQNFTESVIQILKRFDIQAKSYKRKHDYPLYIKGFEDIVSFLALVGAYSILLKWENKKIIKELKNYANRLANCDSANVNKIVNASMQQLSDIVSITKTIGLSRLPNSLKEVAIARIENPDVSLLELGQMLDPPISKSAVYHRMLRIGRLANQALN